MQPLNKVSEAEQNIAAMIWWEKILEQEDGWKKMEIIGQLQSMTYQQIVAVSFSQHNQALPHTMIAKGLPEKNREKNIAYSYLELITEVICQKELGLSYSQNIKRIEDLKDLHKENKNKIEVLQKERNKSIYIIIASILIGAIVLAYTLHNKRVNVENINPTTIIK